jgi:hypothetical protein
MLDNNVLYAFCGIAHVVILDPYMLCNALDSGMRSLNQVPTPYNSALAPRYNAGLWISRFIRACIAARSCQTH